MCSREIIKELEASGHKLVETKSLGVKHMTKFLHRQITRRYAVSLVKHD